MTMKQHLALGIVAVALLLAAIAFLVIRSDGGGLHSRARREWKEQAITEIAHRVGDSTWIMSETNLLQTRSMPDQTDSEPWLSEHLILMKSGGWIAYASKCVKEDHRIHDIFIGRASDGKWYYSTYHFCVGMLELKMEEQPDSLAKFIATYSLREFDGRSDECLNITWPPTRR